MDRKEFIRTFGFICAGGAATIALLEGCTGVHYATATSQDKQLSIKKTEFEQTDKNKNAKFVLVKTEQLNFPICIYALKDNQYSAVLLECTHNSCELQPRGDYLVCPCHGSEFSKLGIVQNPPAENNLRTFKITSDNEHLYIQL